MFKVCFAIMEREVFYLWRDKGLRYILILGPLFAMLLFAGVYSFQRIGDLPTAIVDLDKSSASQQVITDLNNAQNLQVVSYPDSYEQLEESIKRGEVIVGIIIPENYGKNVALHRQTKVAVRIDGMNMAYATNASTAILTVTRTLGAQVGIETLIARGIQPTQAQEAYLSIDYQEEAWFNPTLNYAYFLVLAFALNIWQQCCMLAACMNVIGETGVRSWLQIKASGISKFQLFFCKSLVQIATFMLVVFPLYILAFGILKMPLACGWSTFLLFTLLFTITLHSLGTMMSSLCQNAVNASRYGMIIALPSFLISGFTWPIEAMPQWFQPLVWFLPQTWFFQGINYLTFKNPGWEFMSHYFLTLGFMAAFCYSVAALFTWSGRTHIRKG